MKEAALEYARAGIKIVPIGPKKRPITEHGAKDASCDVNVVAEWWDRNPDANIGVVLGEANGFFALDIDYDDGCKEDYHLSLPPQTPMCITGKGNRHAYFKMPDHPIKNGMKLETGVQVRCIPNYYVVAPPSIHPETKKPYVWQEHEFLGPLSILFKEMIAEAPPEMLSAMRCEPKSKAKMNTGDGLYVGLARNNYLAREAGFKRVDGMSPDQILCVLTALNNTVCSPPLAEADVDRIAKSVGSYEPGAAISLTGKVNQQMIDGLNRDLMVPNFRLRVEGTRNFYYRVANHLTKELEPFLNREILLRAAKLMCMERSGGPVKTDIVNRVARTFELSAIGMREQPKPFAWPEQDEWCLKKIPFSPVEGDYPAWEEFLNRLSAPHDFMAFVWSIFEYRNKSRQFLYMFDPAGQGGKSTVIRVLGDLLGPAHVGLTNMMANSEGAGRWLMSMLEGKRLATWADCKNSQFGMTESLRNLSSGDYVTVDVKGKPPYTTKMYVKLIIGSNDEPQITSAGADISRLIRINVRENDVNKNDPAWEDQLRAELPFFLYDCRGAYEELCPEHGDINVSSVTRALANDSTEAVESKYEDIVRRRIQFGAGLTATVGQWTEMCRFEQLKNVEISNLKKYLSGHDGVSIKRRVIDGRKVSTYSGFNIVHCNTGSGHESGRSIFEE
jgi:putative DNA primase/helicase